MSTYLAGVEGWWDSGSLLIDKSNVDEIIERQKDEAARTKWFAPVVEKQLAEKPVKPMDQAS